MSEDTSLDPVRQALWDLLGGVTPFSALSDEQRTRLVEAAIITTPMPGALVLDGFRRPSDDVYVVVKGRVGLWQEVESKGQPDDTLRAGGFFGFSAMLTGRTVGPRARALTRCTIARIPGDVANVAFVTPAGARFLTEHLLTFAEYAHSLPGFATTGALIDQPPHVVAADVPVREVAIALTEHRLPGVVVELDDDEGLGLVTDGSIRRRVLVEGLPADAPAADCLARGVPVVGEGDSAGEVLLEILGARTEAAIVTDRHGRLKGVVGLREFALSPTTADIALHEQMRLASTRDELVQRVAQTPDVLSHLLARGLEVDKVIRVHSGLVDVVVRRALELCLAEHPELDTEGFTWLLLGSNGRRESVLSSDIESAVIFPDGTPESLMQQYRQVFAEVDALLATAGLAGDSHGVSAQNRILARTVSEWNTAARGWLKDPWKDKGGVMISLLVDARPIHGDPALAETSLMLQNLRSHPRTMRLLLNDALSMKAKVRVWDARWRRQARFDVKHDALTPLVNLARWVGLASAAGKLNTPDRLLAGVGGNLLEPDQGPVLAEAFELLQRVRLRHQLDQVQAGQAPTDLVPLSEISPIDRSILSEAVHEIAVAQRRLASMADTVEQELRASRRRR